MQAGADAGTKEQRRQLRREPPADTHHHGGAQDVQRAEREQRARGHDREHQQGFEAPGRQDTVIDLEHIQRLGEHQGVENEAEHGDCRERKAAGAQGAADGVLIPG